MNWVTPTTGRLGSSVLLGVITTWASRGIHSNATACQLSSNTLRDSVFFFALFFLHLFFDCLVTSFLFWLWYSEARHSLITGIVHTSSTTAMTPKIYSCGPIPSIIVIVASRGAGVPQTCLWRILSVYESTHTCSHSPRLSSPPPPTRPSVVATMETGAQGCMDHASTCISSPCHAVGD